MGLLPVWAGAGFSIVLVVVAVAVASLGAGFSVFLAEVVVAFFPVLVLAGAGVLDHLHPT